MTEQRRIPKSFVWTALIVIAVCVLGYLAYREQHGATRLTVIRAAIAEYHSRVQSLEGHYSSTYVLRPSTSTGSNAGQTTQYENDIAVDFKKSGKAIDARELVMFADMHGAPFRIRRDTRHGVGTRYELTYVRRDPQHDRDDWGEPHLLLFSPGGNGDMGPSDLCALAGLPTRSRAGLIDEFKDGDMYGSVRYDGTEMVNGALCERVSIFNDTIQTTVWLDPAHDYLPRRQGSKGNISMEVFEFQQFRDAADGSLRWFPSRGVMGQVQFTVAELTINPTLDASRFRIDPASLPEGVKVRNGLKGGKWTYTGDREDLWQERDDKNEEGIRILKMNGQPR